MGNIAKGIEDKVKRKGGRPPGSGGMHALTKQNIRRMQNLAAQHAEEAIAVIVSIMRNEEADHAVRLKASNDLLNRAYGTPVSTSVVMQLNAEDGTSVINQTAIAAASTPELMALAEALARFTQKAEAENLIDVTPELPDGYPDP